VQCVEPPADGNKVEKLVDEALAKAAENLAHLEQIQQVISPCSTFNDL
jgi:hypothetical protein